jgi:hypothetical protein
MKNSLWHMVGCLIPLLLIFILPLIGIQGQSVTVIAFVAMLGCHLVMMRGHGGHHSQKDDQTSAGK